MAKTAMCVWYVCYVCVGSRLTWVPRALLSRGFSMGDGGGFRFSVPSFLVSLARECCEV